MGTVLSSTLKIVGKSALKIAIKIGLNAIFPGLGASVEIVEALVSFYNGDYMDGMMSLGSAVFELVSLGTSIAAKKAAETAGKKILIQTAREHKTQFSKHIGREASKKIATGFDKDLTINYAKMATKRFGKMLGRNVGKDLGNGLIGMTVEQSFAEVTKTNVDSIFLAAVNAGIESGGQNIKEGMFLGVAEEAFNLTRLIAPKMPMPAFKSVGGAAVKKIAMESARSMKREADIFATSTAITKGMVKIIRNQYEQDFSGIMQDETSKKILDAYILSKLANLDPWNV